MKKIIILAISLLGFLGMFATAKAVVTIPATTSRGALWIGSTATRMINLPTSTKGYILQISPSTGIPVWSATSTLGLGAGTTNYLTLSDTSLYPTSTLYKLGIGTTTPQTALVVNGTILAGAGSKSNVSYGFISEATSTGFHIQSAGVVGLNVPTSFRVDVGDSATIYDFQATQVLPAPDNTNSLGADGYRWSDLFLGNGAVINMNGDITITHATDVLAIQGGNVGIGTTTPSVSLYVNGSSTISNSLSVGTLNGIIKGTSGLFGIATPGIDYQIPLGSNYVSSTVGTAPIFVSQSTGAITISLGLTAVSSTRQIICGNGLLGCGDFSVDRTMYFSSSIATSTITTVTSTLINATTIHYADNTLQKTAYKEIGFNTINTTTTLTNATIQKLFYQASTIVQVDCSTNGSPIVISADRRASSTPDTTGTTLISSSTCLSGGFSTSTFSSSTIPALTLLNFNIVSTPDSTTTLRVNIKYSQD